MDERTKAPSAGAPKTDLSDVCGSWTDDPAFDEILAAQRKIDWDNWLPDPA